MESVNSQTSKHSTAENDPLIDEVREIRREIGERNAHDLDRVFEELWHVERDYADRSGVFSGVSNEAAAKVEDSWGDLTGPGSDPLLDEVRAVRTGERPARPS